MKDHTYTRYENHPAVIINGPLKGRCGTVKSVSIQEDALIELQGSHIIHSTPLRKVKLQDLAFELYAFCLTQSIVKSIDTLFIHREVQKWYRVSNVYEFEEVKDTRMSEMPSLLATRPEVRERTPEPEQSTVTSNIDPWSVDILDTNSDPCTIRMYSSCLFFDIITHYS